MKNMNYWKAKNGLPGINHDFEKDGNMPDGRSKSSPFQKNGDEHAFDKLKREAAEKRKSKHKLPTIKQIGKKVKKDIKGAVSQVKSDIKNVGHLLKGRKPWKGHGDDGPGERMEGYPRWVKSKENPKKKQYVHKYWKKMTNDERMKLENKRQAKLGMNVDEVD